MPDSSSRLNAITQRLEASTPGPWRWEVSYHLRVTDEDQHERVRHISAGGDDNRIAVMDSDFDSVDADAELIANAPTDLRYLLDRLERAEAVVEAAAKLSINPMTTRVLLDGWHDLEAAFAVYGGHGEVGDE
jgi:hypothetical protein